MNRLEIRLIDETGEWRVLATYDPLKKEEILLRFACDYFVQGTKVYEKVASLVKGDLAVLYVKQNLEENVFDSRVVFAPDWEGIRIEVRHFDEGWAEYPLVGLLHFYAPLDAVLQLNSDRFQLKGKEWEKTSAEVDENRKVYVIYAQPVRH